MNKKLRILLINDDETTRISIYQALKKTELDIDWLEAKDEQTAITILQKTNFDCVFLDYSLPNIDGINLLQNLTSMGIKVPLIVLSDQEYEQVAVKMIKAGASDYLSKSQISSEILSHSLRQAISIHKAETEAELANRRLRESNQLLREKNQELEQQRQQIKLQHLQLQQAYQLKSKFLSTLSHELRTPMNAIIGFSQILLSNYPDPLTSKQINIVERIYKNSKNLLKMINEVLDFSKIEAGEMKLISTTFNLEKLVKMTVEELRSLAIQKKLILNVNIEMKDPFIMNDQKSCKSVLVNLLSNAIKFTSIGSVSVKVWELDEEKVAIAIEDTGIGIASEDMNTIFQPFQQVDQTITRQYSGTGLGLAISYSQVKMMGGKIIIESEKNKGSLFQVEIPRQVKT